MEYTTRLGSGPTRAHVNYQCPCGCIGGVIYNSEKPLSKAGACCCGRKLWVGSDAEACLRPYLEAGVDYEWDVSSVALPWGETAPAVMAWPKDSVSAEPGVVDTESHDSAAAAAPQLVRDVVCGMMIEPAQAAATSNLRGVTYYFCAESCKTKFEAEPQAFVRGPSLLDRLLRR